MPVCPPIPLIPPLTRLPRPVRLRLRTNNYVAFHKHDYARTVCNTELEDLRLLREVFCARVWVPLPTCPGPWWFRPGGGGGSSASARVVDVVVLSLGPHYRPFGEVAFVPCSSVVGEWQSVMEVL